MAVRAALRESEGCEEGEGLLGAALWEPEGTGEGLAEGVGGPGVLPAAEVEAVAVGESWGLGEALVAALALGEREVLAVALLAGEPEGSAGEALAAALGVALSGALGEGVQVGGADTPVVRQPPQGQGVGWPLPVGQKWPTGHTVCVALVEFTLQK